MKFNEPGIKRILYIFAICFTLISLVMVSVGGAEHREEMQGPYLVVEGMVSRIEARSLVIDGQTYPISKFAQVFFGSTSGQAVSLQMIVNVGKIDQAKLYILGGKVEKIVILKNI
jgi:hypothetical protein